MADKKTSMRYLKQKAKAGDVSAIFQLYKSYSENVEGDEGSINDAKKYFNDCVLFLKANDGSGCHKNRFLLKKLILVGFRRFEKEVRFEFDEKLTVLIGENGGGKTTVLESIAKTLDWVSRGIQKEGSNGKSIQYSDINNNLDRGYADIVTCFSFGEEALFEGRLSRAVRGAEERRDSRVEELKYLANIWREINAKEEIVLPLFAYYSVARSCVKKKGAANYDSEILESLRRFEAYSGSLDGGGNFYSFLDRFVFMHKRAAGGVARNDFSQLPLLKQQIDKLSQMVTEDQDPLFTVLQQKKEEYEKALAQEGELSISNLTAMEQKKTVIDAIVNAVPGVTNVYVEMGSGKDEVMVIMNGRKLNFFQLSDGQRVFIALVADIACRLMLLNPHRNNPLLEQGIVLIDEMELHLHPSWQQEVVLKLQETFPNIQWIITTHSPQVLSTVDRKCIRQLENKSDGEFCVIVPDFQTKGVMSSDVLEQIMGTSSVPRVLESEWLTEFMVLILENKYREPEAEALFEKLKKHFGENHFEIQRCVSQIRLQEMKNELQNSKKSKESE